VLTEARSFRRPLELFPSKKKILKKKIFLGTPHLQYCPPFGKTNNYAEALHRKLQLGFGVAHPNLWKFLDGMRRIQKGFDLDYEQHVAGHAPAVKRTRYAEADARILNKIADYKRNNVIRFLREISHNYRMD
jgi:hypothetical protein